MSAESHGLAAPERRYPETRIGAFDFSEATGTEVLGYASGSPHRASIDSCREVAADLGLYSQPDPLSQPSFVFETGAVTPPFATKDGSSLFAYVSGNPLRYSDLLGLARVANCGCQPVPASGNSGPGQGTGPQVDFMIPADCKVYGAGNPIPGTGTPGVTDIDFIDGAKYRGTDKWPTWYIYDDCNGGTTISPIPPFTGIAIGPGLPYGFGSLLPPGPVPGCCCKDKK